MNQFKKLREEALAQRDSLIRHAREQYKLALKEIDAIQTRLGSRRPKVFCKFAYKRLGIDEPEGQCASLTSVQAAKLVLSEGRPMVLRELVIEIQTRGHRPYDKLRTVTNAVRISMQYHPELFRLNAAGLWELAPGAEKRAPKGARTFR